MNRDRFMLPLADIWRPLLLAIAGLSILLGLLSYRLGTLTPGLAGPEVSHSVSASSISNILDNPLHLHQKLGQLALQKTGNNHAAAMRLPSIAVAVLVVISMYAMLRFWYTRRVAFLGTLMVGSSSWFLHIARLGTPDINFTLPFVLAIGGVWIYKRQLNIFASTFLVLVAVTLLYTPGLVWLFLPALVWQRRTVNRMLQRMPAWWQAIFVLLLIIGIAPLLWAFSRDTGLILTWLGLPGEWPQSIGVYLKNLINVPAQLFIRGSGDPLYGIGRLPLLDVFTSVMVVLGIFASFFRLRLDRTKLIMGSGIIGLLLIGLDGPVSISFLLPHVYILAISGVALMLQQWFTVFPRNPVARWTGIIIVTASVLLSSYYHLTHYFIAWPNVPETKTTFSQKV